MDAQILSGKATFEVDTSFDNDRFMKLKVYVMHSGKNYNGSSFSLDSISEAKESLANTPILANVIEKEDGTLDFGSHDLTIEENKLKEGEYKIIYQEKVVGVVPETNNYELVEKEGKTYVTCDSYVYRDYSNYVEDLLEKQDSYSVSMEILVDDYSLNDKGVFDINKYRYTGITILGTEALPGMKNANLEVQKFSMDETTATISKFTQELKDILMAKDDMGKDEKSEDMAEDEPETDKPDEEKPVDDEMGCGDKKQYEITMLTKLQKLQDGIEDEVIVDGEDNYISGKYFWVFDATDTFAYISEYSWVSGEGDSRRDVRATYDAETLIIDKSSMEEVFVQYLTKAEVDMVEATRTGFEQEIANLKASIETMSNENAILMDFKVDIERQKAEYDAEQVKLAHQAEVDDKMAEFEDEIGSTEDFKALKESAYSMGVEEVEIKCFAIVGKNKHKPSKQVKAPVARPIASFVAVSNMPKSEPNKPVTSYGVYDKFLNTDNNGGNNNG